jgi:hypothetical protein
MTNATRFPARFDRRTLLRGALAMAAASSFPFDRSEAAEALGARGEKVILSDGDIARLRKSIQGAVILPGSPEYESARKVWNPTIDNRPALIARCTSVADIRATLEFARHHDVLTGVRCGGHGYSGYAVPEGGLVIDLSPFSGVEVDSSRRLAWVSGGALLGNLDRATVPLGLATTAGVVSHTGVGGLATVCGQGRLARRYGYTIDNIRAVEIVTPDGRLVRASSQEHPDLFWAIRGGGGNFGIVTKFGFQLHEFDPNVTSFSYVWPFEKARDALNLYFELSDKVPNEMSLSGGFNTSEKGETTVSISGTYLGAPEAAEHLLTALGSLGAPSRKRFDAINYVKLQSIADGTLLSPRAVYYRSGFFNRVDPRLSDTVVDYLSKSTFPGAAVRFSQQGGAPNLVAQSATAFPDRDALHQCTVDVEWIDPSEAAANRKYADDTWDVIGPLSDGGYYLNWAINPSAAEVRRVFRGNYERLVQVKTKYDPTNFLHLNANIKPA